MLGSQRESKMKAGGAAVRGERSFTPKHVDGFEENKSEGELKGGGERLIFDIIQFLWVLGEERDFHQDKAMNAEGF